MSHLTRPSNHTACYKLLVAAMLMTAFLTFGEQTINYLKNADFADVPESGIPTGWGTKHWGLWGEDMNKMQHGWKMDYDVTRNGIPSFLIDANVCGFAPVPFSSFRNAAPAGDKTFSVWLKTDKPGSVAVIEMAAGGKEPASRVANLTTEWQRYSVTYNTQSTTGTVNIYARAGARVFVNSPQLEAGKQATDFTTWESIPLPEPLDMSGEQKHEIEFVTTTGGALKYPTRSTLYADSEGLHIHLYNSIPADHTERRTYNTKEQNLWSSSDSVSIFLKPEGEDKALYQLIVTEDGSFQDMRSSNANWDSIITHPAAFEPGKAWTADVFIPYATLNQGGKIKLQKNWRFLIGREHPAGSELGVSAKIYSSFFFMGTTSRWGTLANMPVEAVNESNLKFGKAVADNDTFVYPITNNSQEQRLVQIDTAVRSSNDAWDVQPARMMILDSNSTANITLAPPKDFPECCITLRENGKIIASICESKSFSSKTKPNTFQPKELIRALYIEHKIFPQNNLKQIKDMGYNTVIAVSPTYWEESVVGAQLDALQQAGLGGIINFLFHTADESHVERLKSVVTKYKDHPALRGWLICDEPMDTWNGVEFCNELYKILKPIDTKHPLWTNYRCDFKMNRPLLGDMIGYDHYPIPDEDPAEMLAMTEAATRYGDAGFVYMQQTGHAYFYGREPTISEYRFMAAACLLKGAVALGSFANLPLSMTLRRELPNLFQQLDKEFPIWRGEKFEIAQPIDSVVAEGRIADGKKYYIYLNTSRNAVDFKAFDNRQMHLDGLGYVILE